MLQFVRVLAAADQAAQATLTLSFEQRSRSRLKVTLDNGVAAGLFLPRGTVLQQGDKVQAESGEVVEIRAAEETVSSVYVENPLMIARSCYHLGNRHVALQITEHFIRYQHDHVLDDMLRGLGLEVTVEQAPFEPEAGAYGNHAHSHSHGHSHDHGDSHAH